MPKCLIIELVDVGILPCVSIIIQFSSIFVVVSIEISTKYGDLHLSFSDHLTIVRIDRFCVYGFFVFDWFWGQIGLQSELFRPFCTMTTAWNEKKNCIFSLTHTNTQRTQQNMGYDMDNKNNKSISVKSYRCHAIQNMYYFVIPFLSFLFGHRCHCCMQFSCDQFIMWFFCFFSAVFFSSSSRNFYLYANFQSVFFSSFFCGSRCCCNCCYPCFQMAYTRIKNHVTFSFFVYFHFNPQS